MLKDIAAFDAENPVAMRAPTQAVAGGDEGPRKRRGLGILGISTTPKRSARPSKSRATYPGLTKENAFTACVRRSRRSSTTRISATRLAITIPKS